MGRVPIAIVPSRPASRLTRAECGPGHVDHDRRPYDAPVRERHPGDPLVVTLDADDLGAEPEPSTERLGSVLQVAGGQLRVVDVARVRHPDRTGEGLGGLGPERVVVHPGRRTHHACVEQGQSLLDLPGIPVLVGDAERVEQRHHLRGMPAGSRSAIPQVTSSARSEPPAPPR